MDETAGRFGERLPVRIRDRIDRQRVECRSVYARSYVCHELVHGVWRKNFSTDSRQPPTGFTVRTTESAHQVDLLRAAYMVGDPKMRDTIRRIAELSIAFPDWIWGRDKP